MITCSLMIVMIAMSCNPQKNNANGPVYNDNKPSSGEMNNSGTLQKNNQAADSLQADSLKRTK
jgi:hypothetical protein